MKLLNQLKDLVSKNSEKITDGLGKATTQIDKRTGGKYSDKLEKVSSTVEGQIEKLATEDIDLTDEVTDLTDEATDAAESAADAATDAVDDKLGG